MDFAIFLDNIFLAVLEILTGEIIGTIYNILTFIIGIYYTNYEAWNHISMNDNSILFI